MKHPCPKCGGTDHQCSSSKKCKFNKANTKIVSNDGAENSLKSSENSLKSHKIITATVLNESASNGGAENRIKTPKSITTSGPNELISSLSGNNHTPAKEPQLSNPSFVLSISFTRTLKVPTSYQ